MKVTALPNFLFHFETDFGTFELRPSISLSHFSNYDEKTRTSSPAFSEIQSIYFVGGSVTFNGKTYSDRVGDFRKDTLFKERSFDFIRNNNNFMTDKAREKFQAWFNDNAVPYFESINVWAAYRVYNRVNERARELSIIETAKKELAKLEASYNLNKQGVTASEELEAELYCKGEF